jgi:hypothetical protein
MAGRAGVPNVHLNAGPHRQTPKTHTQELITMAETLSLLEFIQKLFSNEDGVRDLFRENPDQTLADNGLADLTEDDVQDALVLVDDSQTADFSRNYDTGGNSIDFSDSNFGSRNSFDNDRDRDNDDDGDGGGHKAAVEHLSRFITNNFVDDRDTTVDNSVNQQIDTAGGDFDQDIDIDSNVASGDGAVAADDITNSDVVTGDGNVVGDENVVGDGNVTGDNAQVVSGDDNTTSFGEGDATSTEVDGDVTVGDGGSFSSGSGDTVIDNSDNSTDIEDSGNVDNSVNDSGNLGIEDSFQDNSENDIDSSTQDNDDNSSSVETRVDESEDVDVVN